jgi:nicotinamide phosphoribosyltransferase
VKATAGVIEDKEMHVFKCPKTDSGIKKSAKGWISVVYDPEIETLRMIDELYPNDPRMKESLLVPVFENGNLLVDHKLSDIRERVKKGL